MKGTDKRYNKYHEPEGERYEGVDLTEWFKEHPGELYKSPYGNVTANKDGRYPDRYVQLQIKSNEFGYSQKMFYRVIWENYHGMKLPHNVDIDHVDGNPYNCHISNLRAIQHGYHKTVDNMKKKLEYLELEREVLLMRIRDLEKYLKEDKE